MNTEIIRIIEGGLANDRRKIISYSNRLADRLSKEGDIAMAKCILNKIQDMPSSVAADAIRTLPMDADSRMQIVEVIPPSDIITKIVISPIIQMQINEFVELVNNASQLEIEGVDISKTLLLYGAPGCGKTSIAHFIAQQTNLPLVIARLDGIVSSLLGSTAKNIRRIFEYVQEFPCILFLDEFDAIAKARDDHREIGELKRVINSLLQNIDAMPKHCTLIAATNHPELLDKAVWRRFVQKIEVSMPTELELNEMMAEFARPFASELSDNSVKSKTLSVLFSGMSPSDIKTIFDRAKIKCVLDGTKTIRLEQILLGVFELKESSKTEVEFVRFLSSNGISQRDINELTHISLRQIKKYLRENE